MKMMKNNTNSCSQNCRVSAKSVIICIILPILCSRNTFPKREFELWRLLAGQNEQKQSMEQKIPVEQIPFKLHSEYQPTEDQPAVIEALVKDFKEGNQFQTLLGVTGSGKTFTMANVIQQLNNPTLVIAHNKTLAGQLYGELKEFSRKTR